jgi:tRNA (guanine-N7-)-methyltransferase
MGRKRKKEHWAEMETFPHAIQPSFNEIFNTDYKFKGKWHTDFFKSDKPLVLELGCGKGEYSVGLAQAFPNKLFMGVDVKGHRMWRGAKTAVEKNIDNVFFLRTRIEFIQNIFGKDEVSEIWITFPDPQPGDKREKKRLTSDGFIKQYQKFLKSGGIIHLKTDNRPFFDYTLEQVAKHKFSLLFHTFDLYGDAIDTFDEQTKQILGIKTHYEKIFSEKGFKINYLKFKI